MGRIRVQSYGNGKSKSAKVLAEYIRVKRIKVTGSRFVGKNGDIVVNWGMPQNKLPNVMYLNPIEAVSIASNKLQTLSTLSMRGVSAPRWWINKADIPDNVDKLMARTLLSAHSGQGIVAGTKEEVPNAPLYTEYIKKVAEYRVIVVANEAIDIKCKMKKRDFEGERSEEVWNLSNGYVFARNSSTFHFKLPSLAVEALKALGLCYGAVDIIEDSEGRLYVLEVNTAFGLEGTTINLVGEAILNVLRRSYYV